MFLLLLAGISQATPLGGQLTEHLQSGVSLSDPALTGTLNEYSSDFQQGNSTSFVLPTFHVQTRSRSVFFHASGKRLELTAAVSPRGPPALS